MATAIGRLAGQNGLTPEQFIAQLEASGGSYADLRDNIGSEMIIQRVQSGNVNQRIEINAAEIDAFLKTSDGEELIQPVYRLLHARLDVPETLDFEAAKTQVEVLGDRIKQGEEFNQVIAS